MQRGTEQLHNLETHPEHLSVLLWGYGEKKTEILTLQGVKWGIKKNILKKYVLKGRVSYMRGPAGLCPPDAPHSHWLPGEESRHTPITLHWFICPSTQKLSQLGERIYFFLLFIIKPSNKYQCRLFFCSSLGLKLWGFFQVICIMSELEDTDRPQMQFPAVLSFYFQGVKHLMYSWPLRAGTWYLGWYPPRLRRYPDGITAKSPGFCSISVGLCHGKIPYLYVSSSTVCQHIAWLSAIFIKQVGEIQYRMQSCLEIAYDWFNPPLQYYRTGK